MSLGRFSSFTATKNSEFRCGTCRIRCTRSPNSDLEYGHLIGCSNRPEEFGKSASDGGRFYKPDDVEDATDGGASA